MLAVLAAAVSEMPMDKVVPDTLFAIGSKLVVW
jgi:hypothetical protein